MKSNANRRLDAFSFSLGGISVASSFAAIPVVANDSIAKAWDKRLAGVKRTDSVSSSPQRFGELSAECP